MRIGYIGIIIIIVLILSIFLSFFLNRQKPEIKIELKESFCDDIDFDPLYNVCLIAFSKNIESCKNVEKGYDIVCYDIVVGSLDVSESICESIKSDYGKFLCNIKLANKLEDPELCNGNYKCYTNLASSTKDYSICNYIDFEQERYSCLAKTSGKTEYCNNIGDEFEKNVCKNLVPKDLVGCELESYYNFDCLSELAYKEKNSTICNLITLEEVKWKCIINVENNPEVCYNAPDFFKDICRIEYLKNQMMN